jgi:hypothetical protein
MGAPDPLRLADLVEESLGLEVEVPAPRGPRSAGRSLGVDLRDLSALLVELARTPDAEVDVASGWSPGVAPGDTVERFILGQELGRGGSGVVFEAFDTELGRCVAFKALRPGRRHARAAEWLRGEAEAVARLDHPNIAALRDFGRGPMGPYLVFELLRGETLADRMQRGRLALRSAVAVATDVARVLAHAHAKGVVHRDLKPANVFVCGDGKVKVLDFGLAHLFGRAGRVSGGTPAYMAPEQWRGDRGDERTDLFALGVLLFHMITGRVPYHAGPARSEAQEAGPVPALPVDGAPVALRKLSATLLAKAPQDRPRRSSEVLEALLAVEQDLDGRGARVRTAWLVLLAAAASGALALGVARGDPLLGSATAGVAERPLVRALGPEVCGGGRRSPPPP